MNAMSENSGTTTMTTPFKVDNWWIDPSDNQARHIGSGIIRTLEPRLMRLVCALATSPGRVIDRDSLIDSVWPRVIVNENSLTRAVSDLRKALQTEEVSGKQLIETVPKRGYRLMAVVEMLPDATTLPDSEKQTCAVIAEPAMPKEAASQANWHRWLPAMAASLLLIITAVMQLPGRVLEPLAQTSGAETDIEQVRPAQEDRIIDQPAIPTRNALAEQTALSATNTFHWHGDGDINEGFDNLASMDDTPVGTDTAAVLAPEGNLLAYVEHSENASRLMLRPTYHDAKPWTAFTTDETIMQLQWSPLGDGVLFTLQGTAAAGSHEPGHRYRRLMLLDIQSLALHELYRKDDSPAATSRNSSGNLT